MTVAKSTMSDFDYDLAVVGSGPAGHHAAIQGAKLRKRVIMIERKPIIGGICVNVGTIPSKTMREAILYLSGYREHAAYGDSYRVKEKITFQDLLARVDPVRRVASPALAQRHRTGKCKREFHRSSHSPARR